MRTSDYPRDFVYDDMFFWHGLAVAEYELLDQSGPEMMFAITDLEAVFDYFTNNGNKLKRHTSWIDKYGESELADDALYQAGYISLIKGRQPHGILYTQRAKKNFQNLLTFYPDYPLKQNAQKYLEEAKQLNQQQSSSYR